MSQYPVENNQELFQAVNYLLSGPSGLGQNFAGFSSSSPAWLTGNFRLPFTVASTTKRATGFNGAFEITVRPNTKGIRIGYLATGFNIGTGAVVTDISYDVANGYVVTLDVANTADVDNDVLFTPPQPAELLVAPISLSTSELLDPYTWKFTFASAQATPPFVNGMGITVSGVSDPTYDGDYTPIGVAECTTTYVIARTTAPYSASGPGTGGTVEYYNTVSDNRPPLFMSTDCNGRVTVTGGTDRVFISAQLDNYISYTTTGTEDLIYTLAVNRYKGFPNTDRVNPDFLFDFNGTVAERVYTFTGLTGTGTLDLVDTIFTSIIDTPGPGYYWYILEVGFQTGVSSDLQVTESEFDLRGLSAQVVKE